MRLRLITPLALIFVLSAASGCGDSASAADASPADGTPADAGMDVRQADAFPDGAVDGRSDASAQDASSLDGGGDAGGGGDGGQPFEFDGKNNGVLVAGASFPGGTAPVSDLRKTVPVTMSSAHPEFVPGQATIARAKVTTTDAFYAIVPVTNVGSRPYCFVSVDAVEYRDSGGGVVADASFRDVSGSVGKTGTVFTPTCLAPSETGYFCDVQILTSYDAVASVVLSIGADPFTDLADPLSRPVPTAYSYEAATGLTVTIENQGSAAARIFGVSSFYILLDASGGILWWHALRTGLSPDETAIAAGASGTLVDPYVHYEGSGTQIRVFLDWADET